MSQLDDLLGGLLGGKGGGGGGLEDILGQLTGGQGGTTTARLQSNRAAACARCERPECERGCFA